MFEPPVQRLIDELARLPGVGRKSAQRIAFHLLNTEQADAERLADAITDMRSTVKLCQRCFNVTAELLCSFAAPMFLTAKAAAFIILFFIGDAAIDQGGIGLFECLLFWFHF